MEKLTNDKVYFYMPGHKAIALFFFLLFSFIIYFAITKHQYGHVALSLFNLIISVGGIWCLSTIAISNDGLVLYRINRLKWHDITSVRKTSFLGLPYILLKRQKGFTWWLPLYFKGNCDIKTAILEAVPNGNPLRESVVE